MNHEQREAILIEAVRKEMPHLLLFSDSEILRLIPSIKAEDQDRWSKISARMARQFPTGHIAEFHQVTCTSDNAMSERTDPEVGMHYRQTVLSILELSEYEHPKRQEERTGTSSPIVVPIKTHPWRRWFARLVDTIVIGKIATVLLAFVVATYASVPLPKAYLNLSTSLFYWFLVFPVSFIFIEALLLTTFGTTPAKGCFGISIRTLNGDNPPFLTALSRAFQVWAVGLWFGIPILCLIPQVSAYVSLNENGETSWDESCGTDVHHKKWGILRCAVCVFVVIISPSLAQL